jgi:hypothetical protein
MKTIIKTTFVAITLLTTIIASAQEKPITFGVKAGVNLSNFTGDYYKSKIGFRAGVSVDYAFTQDLYLLTGLNYSLQGAKLDLGNAVSGTIGNALGSLGDLGNIFGDLGNILGNELGKKVGSKKTNVSYLQLPIHLGYKLEITEETKLVFHAGPYLGYALKKDYKDFDYGVGLGTGAEFGKFGVDLGWDFGLAKVGVGNAKNMNGYLTVGYKF